MKIRAVLETCLYADDLAAAKNFYSAVLGLELIEYEPARHLFFRLDESVVLIFNPERTATEQTEVARAKIPLHGSKGAGHIAFRVGQQDLAAWKSRLSAAAIGIESEVTWPNGGMSIYFRDPAGNSVELASPTIWGM